MRKPGLVVRENDSAYGGLMTGVLVNPLPAQVCFRVVGKEIDETYLLPGLTSQPLDIPPDDLLDHYVGHVSLHVSTRVDHI